MELIGCSWERIQCTVRLRSRQGAPAGERSFGLERLDPGGAPAIPSAIVAPARATSDGADIALRFNVMQGPGQLPLAPGTWQLVSAGRAGGAVHLRDARAVTGRLPEAGFRLREGLLSFTPALDAAGRLTIRVHLDRSRRRGDPGRTPLKRLGSRARGWIRPLRRRLFRVLFAAARASRPPGKPIILFAPHADRLAGNMRLVHDRMVERGVRRDHRLRMLRRPRRGFGWALVDRLRLPLELGRADVIILDDHYPLIHEVDPGPRVRIVQLWHASGAFKTVGYSRAGRPGAPSPYGRTHKNYTHAIVSSHDEVPFYAEAFGIPESRVYPTGIPRMDRFFDEGARAAGRARTEALFPRARGRMTILFAPTFRGPGARGAHYDMARIDFGALHALCVEHDACVIFRMHPFVRQPVPIPGALADRLFDGSRQTIDVNDLLPAADLLVTDYSSTVFEFAALGRPMLFYAYDLDAYVSRRGFYTPYEEFVPGRIVRTFPELLEAIRTGDHQAEKVARFKAQHLDHVDGRSTDRVVDLILRG